jgi:hypothetical protein
LSAHNARVEAVQLLMAVNRQIYFACPEVPSMGDRWRAMLHPCYGGIRVSRKGLSPGRLEAFSDGVIAVIITIMVLELKVPGADGVAGLRAVLPTVFSICSPSCRSGFTG